MTALHFLTPPERRTRWAPMTPLAFPQAAEFLEPERCGWFAAIEVNGSSYHLSKLDGEGPWTIDTAFGPSGLPLWCNGFGARYLLTHTLRDDLAAQVDMAIGQEGGTK